MPILVFFCCASVWIIENAANLVKTEALTKYSLARALHQPMGFSGSSAGKESTCNAGDPSLIPGSGRFAGEGMGYPLQYSWASLMAQLVKNPPAVRETWVWSLGWEDPLEKGKATHSSILAWRIPRTVQSMGSQRDYIESDCPTAKSQTWLSNFHFYSTNPQAGLTTGLALLFSVKPSTKFPCTYHPGSTNDNRCL